MVSSDPGACFLAALLLLTLPLDWLLSAAAAAAFHECCHMGAIHLCGGSISSIRLRVGGAVIAAQIPGKKRELLCIAAGPAGSLLLYGLRFCAPKLAICALVQGLFNLVPVCSLDGGRILKLLLELWAPEKADIRLRRIEMTLTAVGAMVLARRFLLLGGALQPLLLLLLWIIHAAGRKIPCKQVRNRVQ